MVIADLAKTGQQTNGSSAAVRSETTQLEGVREKVFVDRYALKDRDGRPIETTPEQMWRRVAEGIAAVESTPEKQAYWSERFYEALSDFKFVPGGRILAGAGTGTAVTFYNCYVIPSPEDSRGGILDNLKVMVDIMARGGGVGINLSSLRPRGLLHQDGQRHLVRADLVGRAVFGGDEGRDPAGRLAARGAHAHA